MRNHKQSDMYLVFYLAFFAILTLQGSRLLKLDKHDVIYVAVCTLVLLFVAFAMNNKYIEKFEDGSEIQHTQLDAVTINKYHLDKLISEVDVYAYNVVFYFSCFDLDSWDFSKKQWKDMNNTSNSIEIDTEDNLLSIYNQKDGLNISNTQLIGFECSKMNMINSMKQFSLLLYCKLNFQKDGEGRYNLFEMYSANVYGNIALSLKLEKESSSKEAFKILINFAGLKYASTINYNHLLFSNEDAVVSVIKSFVNNEHIITVRIDDKLIFNKKIDYDNIRYVSTNRDRVQLSKERFVMNKQAEGSKNEKVTYQFANITLYNMIMLNVVISDRTVENIIFNLKYQRDTKLHPEVVRLTNERDQVQSSLKEIQQQMDDLNKCKLSSEVCEKCKTVNWSDFSSFSQSPDCIEAMTNKCRDIKNGLVSFTDVESKLCKAMHIPEDCPTNTDLNSKTSDGEAGNSDGIKHIEVDYSKRTGNNNQTIAPTNIDDWNNMVNSKKTTQEDTSLSKEASDLIETSASGLNDFIDDAVTAPLNMSEDVYTNIMKQYETDVETAKSKVDTEEEGEKSPNVFVDFFKYLLFMK